MRSNRRRAQRTILYRTRRQLPLGRTAGVVASVVVLTVVACGPDAAPVRMVPSQQIQSGSRL